MTRLCFLLGEFWHLEGISYYQQNTTKLFDSTFHMFCGYDLAILAISITKKIPHICGSRFVAIQANGRFLCRLERSRDPRNVLWFFFRSQLLTVSKGTSRCFSWTEALSLSDQNRPPTTRNTAEIMTTNHNLSQRIKQITITKRTNQSVDLTSNDHASRPWPWPCSAKQSSKTSMASTRMTPSV